MNKLQARYPQYVASTKCSIIRSFPSFESFAVSHSACISPTRMKPLVYRTKRKMNDSPIANSSKENMKSLKQRTRLSLLDSSPLPEDMPKTPESDDWTESSNENSNLKTKPLPVMSSSDTDFYSSSLPYNDILEQSSKWKAELEEVRDDLYLLRVENAVLLDRLAILGADTF